MTDWSNIGVDQLPMLIKNLTPQNYAQSLQAMEPVFEHDATRWEYDFYLARLKEQSWAIGMAIPAGYASHCRDPSLNYDSE